MKLLISKSELESQGSRALIPLECHFYKPKNEIQKAIKNNLKNWCNFCSQTCAYASRNKKITTLCKQCQVSISVGKKQKLETGNFCSLHCSAIYRNLNKQNKKYFCQYCGKNMKIKQKYCSHMCQHEFQYQDYIEKWKTGLITGSKGMGKISDHIRRYMLAKNQQKCQNCGFDKVHPLSKKSILQIDHINGDWEDNREENLQVLCPNCHALTPTFGGRNKGRGRHVALKKAGYSTR